ncbi:Hypothetical predicted protein, partial [Podarcis lilfordi]
KTGLLLQFTVGVHKLAELSRTETLCIYSKPSRDPASLMLPRTLTDGTTYLHFITEHKALAKHCKSFGSQACIGMPVARRGTESIINKYRNLSCHNVPFYFILSFCLLFPCLETQQNLPVSVVGQYFGRRSPWGM